MAPAQTAALLPNLDSSAHHCMQIALSELEQRMLSMLSQKFSAKDATNIVNCLLWAEMCGLKTQGVVKMTGTEPLQDIVPKHPLRVERDTPLSQLIDGGANPAPAVFQTATEVAIEKAQKSGFAIVGARNTFSSVGALAFYVNQIALADLIGVAVARSPGATAPFNSIDPLFGTNPIAFAFPTDEAPLLFDMATSGLNWYGLVIAKAKGEPLPEGLAIDSQGNLTTDPAVAMKGALLPFDTAHKGSGLGMVVEVLAGPLLGAAFCDCETFDQEWSSTVLALDPSLLVDRMRFKRSCSDMILKMKSARSSDGQPIRLPGERARDAYRKAQRRGCLDVDDAVLRKLGFLSG